jgi:hypothetical protein
MKKTLASAIAISFAFACVTLMMPSTAEACSCAGPATPQDAFQRADVVFSGKVLSVTPTQFNSGVNAYTGNAVLFDVKDTWKGTSSSLILVRTGNGGGDCGYGFIAGNDYLVYAYSRVETLSLSIASISLDLPLGARTTSTGICTRTALLAQAGQDLAALGPGRPPHGSGMLEWVGSNVPYLILVLTFALAAITFVSYRWYHKKRT